jgi:adenylate cyclase
MIPTPSFGLWNVSTFKQWYSKKEVWLNRVFLGFLVGLLGFLIRTDAGLELEENFGLPFLFHLRGAISPPTEAIIVAIDKASADELGLPISPSLWPRNLHARLIENLSRAGAEVIAFDMRFDTPGKIPEHDIELANAMVNAGNVVLVERLDSQELGSPSDHSNPAYSGGMLLRPVPLLPIVEAASVARTTFTLPRASQVNHYRAFNADSGDAPTLPAVVLQLVALDAYDDFVRLLRNASPSDAMQLPADKKTIPVDNLMLALCGIFTKKPQIAQDMLADLNRDLSLEHKTRSHIKSLLSLYCSNEKRYLNFYGPPRTLQTIPYYQALRSDGDLESTSRQPTDFKGKVVFVGFSAASQPEQDRIRDDYHTVFSRSDGLYISGVEIAATAFANLLEDKPLRTLSPPANLFLVFLWGCAIAIACSALPRWSEIEHSRILVILSIGLVLTIAAVIYLTVGYYQFKEHGIWLPLFVPLVLQLLFAVFGTLLLRNYEVWRKRIVIKERLGNFIHKPLLDHIWNEAETITPDSRLVYGTCLATDVERYTKLAEGMAPAELRTLLDNYYLTLSEPVNSHDGNIMDEVGDAMLAIWASSSEDQSLGLRNKACHACLDITDALERFNKVDGRPRMRTRIGLHAGEVILGCVGSPGHYEYRATGDTVNTASRIQDLNKRLGTGLLVSDKVLEGLDDFLTRPLGAFPLRGRASPVSISELLARKKEASREQLWLCEAFADAIRAYELEKWVESCQKLSEILKAFPNDGPAQYYLGLCQKLPSVLRDRRQ